VGRLVKIKPEDLHPNPKVLLQHVNWQILGSLYLYRPLVGPSWSRYGLADDAGHCISQIADPRFPSYME
jgi:hypothetical protein